ncbi:small RNA 2'-O-methyltransferase-like [Zerene cesonia]|uniref:small RNA 2'-O-methyltransferase-like n=1 Tax=Zerene cesonia TaxID=33412 RepID=UPI0018E571B4|nr:small RNA 2'-O-methyltransferase-like [Zerene cesonia]
MAKNKGDALVHTREVVDEIRHLTKMLNFNKGSCTQYGGDHIWCNINWGDNAPYWNQYYRVVRDYNYPFETKSEDCRILDLISEEINRLIDNQWEEDFTADANKLEIPIQHLMQVVQHITEDVEKVKCMEFNFDICVWGVRIQKADGLSMTEWLELQSASCFSVRDILVSMSQHTCLRHVNIVIYNAADVEGRM